MPVAQIIETLNGQEEQIYLRDAYGERAIREMELALVKACETLPPELDNHQCRTFIAKRICARFENGERTFGGMVTAGMAAVDELRRRTIPRP